MGFLVRNPEHLDGYIFTFTTIQLRSCTSVRPYHHNHSQCRCHQILGRRIPHMHPVHHSERDRDLLYQKEQCQSHHHQERQQQYHLDVVGSIFTKRTFVAQMDVCRCPGVIRASPSCIGFHVNVWSCKGSSCGHGESSSCCEYRFDHLFLP